MSGVAVVDGEDGQGVVSFQGEVVGHYYHGEDSGYLEGLFYPVKGLVMDEELCLAVAGLMIEERQERERLNRVKFLCGAGDHSWGDAREDVKFYVCVDCGEPGFWAPKVGS